MEKQDLLSIAKIYFTPESGLKEIFGTSDKQFFYGEFQAKKHASRVNGQYFRFAQEDFEAKELTPKQKLQNEAKELGVEFDSKTSVADLKMMIEIKKEE
jgi:hypothetical protein